MAAHSIDSLCNAALYYLAQTQDRYDPLNFQKSNYWKNFNNR